MPKLSIKPLAVWCCVSIFTCSGTAMAEDPPFMRHMEKGVAYLLSQQNADGSWGSNPDTRMRITARIVETLQHFQLKGPFYEKALVWLANNHGSSTEAIARQSLVLNQAGIKRLDLINQLLAQGWVYNDQLSWGGTAISRATIRDTGLVVKALTALYQRPKNTARIDSKYKDINAGSFIKGKQIKSSGWSELNYSGKTQDVSVLPTAYAIQGIYSINVRYNFKHGGDGSFVNYYGKHAKEGAEWLKSVQKASGEISDTPGLAVYETAESVISLQLFHTYPRAFTAETAINKGREFISKQFSVNGSIQNDLFFTAIALNALTTKAPTWQDTDHDGYPDQVEQHLGMNDQVADTINLYNTDVSLAKATALSPHYAVSGTALPSLNSLGGKFIRFINKPPLTSNKLLAAGNYLLVYEIEDSQGIRRIVQLPLIVSAPQSDVDRDGMVAAYELSHRLNDYDPSDADRDNDADGLSNLVEYWSHTQPHHKDTDNDGLPDGYEVFYHLNPNEPDADEDPDQDGLTNLAEYHYRANPHHHDTDHDNTPDAEEAAMGRQPAIHEPAVLMILSDQL